MKLISLSKFIANAGICSRRKSTILIKNGDISVNGSTIFDPFYKICIEKDRVIYKNNIVKPLDNKIYIILNKPVGYITTTSDENGRKNVLDLLPKIKDRLYPIGRLDKDTTGLLILTNDGYLTQKLSHPRNSIKKIYKVTLNKTLLDEDLNKIRSGLYLSDGFIKPDKIYYFNKSKSSVIVELHSGKNRIIRRIFNYLYYNVIALDRISYAGLKKMGLKVGSYRFLSKSQIRYLYNI